MKVWMIQSKAGELKGPASTRDVARAVHGGIVRPDQLVTSVPGDGVWSRIDAVPELKQELSALMDEEVSTLAVDASDDPELRALIERSAARDGGSRPPAARASSVAPAAVAPDEVNPAVEQTLDGPHRVRMATIPDSDGAIHISTSDLHAPGDLFQEDDMTEVAKPRPKLPPAPTRVPSTRPEPFAPPRSAAPPAPASKKEPTKPAAPAPAKAAPAKAAVRAKAAAPLPLAAPQSALATTSASTSKKVAWLKGILTTLLVLLGIAGAIYAYVFFPRR